MATGRQPLTALAKPQHEQKPTEKLHIHVTNVDALQTGQFNTLLYITGSDTEKENKDDDRQYGGDSEVTIVNENNVQLHRYTIHGATVISIGDNCSLVEIKLNKEIEKKLKETGEFAVTRGDKLVSVLWRNDTKNNDSLTMTELKINFLKDGKQFNTKELEKEIYDIIREENNVRLRELISELTTTFHAKLEHIEIGCLQLVVSSKKEHHVRLFEKQIKELKDLLRRTIIPKYVDMDISFRTKGEEKFKSAFESQIKQEPSLKLRQKEGDRQKLSPPALVKSRKSWNPVEGSVDDKYGNLGRALRNIGDGVSQDEETWSQTIRRYSGLDWLMNKVYNRKGTQRNERSVQN